MDEVVEKIHSLLSSRLVLDSPVLSGNMKAHIRPGPVAEGEGGITIDAPFYDLRKWRREGVIVHTNATLNGMTAYADIVNRFGGFMTHNESEGWVNRAILNVVRTVANEIGAEVIYEL